MDDYKVKSYEEVYKDLMLSFFGGITLNTDSNQGNVLCSLFEVVARVISEAYLYSQIGYSDYLNGLVEGAFGLKRLQGTKAEGLVVFSTENGKGASKFLNIPKDTEIMGDGIIFKTLEDGGIEKGSEESRPIKAIAKDFGLEGNLSKGKISVILSTLNPEIKNVTNIQKFENGSGIELDNELRKRFVNYLRGLQKTNVYGMREAAMSVGAKYINIVLFSPARDKVESLNYDGTTKYVENVNCAVYVCAADKTCSGQLVTAVEDRLRGDGSPENPGYIPAGVKVAVAPIITDNRFTADNKLEVKVKSSYPDKDKAEKIIINGIVDFFNRFEVGESLLFSNLILEVRRHTWISDVVITNPKKQNDDEDNPPATEPNRLLVIEPEFISVIFE